MSKLIEYILASIFFIIMILAVGFIDENPIASAVCVLLLAFMAWVISNFVFSDCDYYDDNDDFNF